MSTNWLNESADRRCACGTFTKVESCASQSFGGKPPCVPSSLHRSLLLFAATCLGVAGACRAGAGPSRYFTGSDLFNLEWASDPEISPDGRTIAYVRQSNDIMTDKARPTIWLIDVATGQQRPLIAGPGSYFSPRWSPDGTRLAYVAADGGSPQLYVRWMSERRKRADHRPSRAARSAIAWSPDGRRIAYSMFVPDEPPTLGKAPPKPEGAKWADPLQVIDKVTYRSDDAGYLKSGYRPDFLGPGGWRRTDPADLRRDQCRRRGLLDSRRPLDPVQRQSVAELGARAAPERGLPDQHRWRRARRTYQSRRAGQFAGRFARRPPDRLRRLRRQAARLSEHAASRHEPRRLGQARSDRRARPVGFEARFGPPTAARSTSRSRTAASTRSSASASTARSARSRATWASASSTVPMPAATSASRGTARSRSPRRSAASHPDRDRIGQAALGV